MRRKTAQGIGIVGKMAPNPTEYTFKLIRELDDVTFAEYREAVAIVGRVRASTQLQLVEKNRTRLASMAEFYRNAIALRRRSKHFEPRNAVDVLSFDVLNWLTATRLFLDHHLTMFADHYGEDSEQRNLLKAAISSEYENSAAYRFLYKLRDYTQHCGFPVDQLTATAAEDLGEAPSTIVEFTASRDRLLADFDWKSKVRGDLQMMPERIDVLALIEQASPCFRRIFVEITRIRLRELPDPVSKLREIAAFLDGQPGSPHLLTFYKDGESGASSINHEAVPLEMVAWFDSGTGPSEYLTRLVRDTSTFEPSELAVPTNLNDGTQRSLEVGAALMNIYYESGGTGALYADAANRIADDLGDITPLLVGVTTVAAVGMAMAGAALGTDARDVLGSITSDLSPSPPP